MAPSELSLGGASFAIHLIDDPGTSSMVRNSVVDPDSVGLPANRSRTDVAARRSARRPRSWTEASCPRRRNATFSSSHTVRRASVWKATIIFFSRLGVNNLPAVRTPRPYGRVNGVPRAVASRWGQFPHLKHDTGGIPLRSATPHRWPIPARRTHARTPSIKAAPRCFQALNSLDSRRSQGLREPAWAKI